MPATIRPLFTKPFCGWTALDLDGADIAGFSYLTHPLADVIDAIHDRIAHPNTTQFIEFDHEGDLSTLVMTPQTYQLYEHTAGAPERDLSSIKQVGELVLTGRMTTANFHNLIYRTIACITAHPVEWTLWLEPDEPEDIRHEYAWLETQANLLLQYIQDAASTQYIQSVQQRLAWNRSRVENAIKRTCQ